MPQLAFGLTNSSKTLSGGVYDAADIGRVEIKDDSLLVEVVLTDLIKSYQYNPYTDRSPKTQPVDRTPPETQQNEVPTFSDFVPSEQECTTPPVSITIPNEQPEYIRPPLAGTPPLSPSTTPSPKGSSFFEEECDTCCHSPTTNPSQVYTLCLIISTDPMITSMIEKGMIDQVYSSIPALQSKFERGEPGAYLQENSLLDFTKSKISRVAKTGLIPDISVTWAGWEPSLLNTGVKQIVTSAYQFEDKFNFKIPPKCEHLALFTFVRLDTLVFNEVFGTSDLNLPQGVFTGAIKELIVLDNTQVQTEGLATLDPSRLVVTNMPTQVAASGQLYSFHPTKNLQPTKISKIKMPLGNIRNHNVLNRIKKVCSTSITEAIQQQLLSAKPALQSKFWLSKASSNTNIAFIMFNYEQIIMQNCFIQNLKSKEVYGDQEIEIFEIEKVDLLDENGNEKINSTTGEKTPTGNKLRSSSYAKTKVKNDQETINDKGGPVILSKLVELPSPSKSVKFLQVIDSSTTPGRFAYKISLKFKDPSIIFLKNATEEYLDKVNIVKRAYSGLQTRRGKNSKNSVAPSSLLRELVDASKMAIARANQILSILPSNDYNPTLFVNYMTVLANPKATKEDHDDFMNVLETLGQTLVGLLRSTGVPIKGIDDIGATTSNSRSATAKQRAFIDVEIQSQEFQAGSGTGIGFLETESFVEQQTKSLITYDQRYLKNRAEIEFSRFWNADRMNLLGSEEAQLKEKATFFLTPTKIYGVDEVIDILRIQDYDFNFERSLKKLKLAREQKATKTSSFYSIMDSLSNLPASFQIVSGEYDFKEEMEDIVTVPPLSDNYLKNQTNFTQNNIETTKNKTKQTNEFVSTDDKIISAIESSFIDGFEKVGKGSIKENIDSTTTLEEVVDRSNISSLPPSLQAYKRRNSEASRMFTFVNQKGFLSEPSNKIYLDNFFGLVARIEYLSFKPTNLNSVEWSELNTSILESKRNLFCRLKLINNSLMRLGQQEVEVYNEYFILENTKLKPTTLTERENIKPLRMLGKQNLSKSEKNIENRIHSIMNQRTTYDSGTPVAYTNIIH